MKEITIDCRGCVPRSELHKALADALSFPDWYGRNLSALHDMLKPAEAHEPPAWG